MSQWFYWNHFEIYTYYYFRKVEQKSLHGMKTSIQVKICFLLQLQDFFSSSLLPPPSPSPPPFIVFIGIPHSIEFLPEFLPGYSSKKKKRVFACGEAASQTEVLVRRSRAGTESDHNYANTTSFHIYIKATPLGLNCHSHIWTTRVKRCALVRKCKKCVR